MSTRALPAEPVVSLVRAPMLLLGLAALQFYAGLLEPVVESLGFDASIIRVLRHAHLAPLGLAFVGVLTIRGALDQLAGPVAAWVRGLVLFIFLMFIMGILRGAFLGAILLDAGIYEAFLVALVVGSRHEHWSWSHRFFRILFYTGAALMLLELLVIETVEGRASITTLAYQIRTVLFAWPLLLFTSPLRHKSERFIILAGMGLIIVMYVLFQKRAPTVRVVFALVLFLWLLPGVAKGARLKLRMMVLGGFSLVILLTTWVIPTASDDTSIVGQSSMALAGRFQGEGGLIETLTTENDRWMEAGFFFDEADTVELAIGKGFGGSVEVPYWWPPRMEITENGRTFFGVYSMHIGLTHPFLKGGFFFWLFFFGGWLVFILRLRHFRRDPRALACWAVLLVNFLFMGVETLWGSGNVVTVILVGFCVGYLGNRRFWEPRRSPNSPSEELQA